MRKSLLMTAGATLMMLPVAAFAGSSWDHSSSNAMDSAGDRATAALNLLEANGYTQFSNFQRAGSDFEATVNRNGRQMTVVVDPDSGKITPQTATASNSSAINGSAGSSTPSTMQSNGMNGQTGSSMNQSPTSPDKATRVYHDFYNPEGGSPPTGGTEGSAAKKH